MDVTHMGIEIINREIANYTKETQSKNLSLFGRFIPSFILRMDGRRLRGYERRGLILMTVQDNGSRDPRYLYQWYDVSLTHKGLALL